MKKNYKLFEIIEVLTKKEVKQLRKLLRSPFFVIREDVKQLFSVLEKEFLQKRKIPSLEVLHKKTFPSKRMNENRIRGTMSDLLELIEELLAINHRQKDKLKTKLLVSAIYRQRKLKKSYNTNITKISHLLEQHPKRNASYFQQMLEFQVEKMKYQIASQRTEYLYFQEISETNDVLYLIQKLQNACSQLSHQSVFKTEYDYGLLKYFSDEIENHKAYMDIPAIAIFYYCFRFLTEKNNLSYFQKFKSQLSIHKSLFTKEELQAPYRLAINFCIRNLNQGDKYYAREGLDLYREGLEEKILLENDLIPRFTFNNMIAMALALEEFDWIDLFIQSNADKLDEDFKEQTINFNLARLAYARKNYNKALLHLQSSEYKDLVNNLISKMLLIKIYFELKEFESLYSQLDSFQQFIRRREVSDYHRTNFMNIIRYIRKIMDVPSFAKNEQQQLYQQILEEPILSEREWLLQKVL